MPLRSYQIKIIDQFKAQELLLADLYRIFGERFVEDREFWQQLSGEEQDHARIVGRLHEAVDKGVLLFDEGKVRTYTLTAMMQRIEGFLQKARQGSIDSAWALTQALDLESSLIEKGVFTHFEPLTEPARATLKKLNAETLQHVARVRQLRDAKHQTGRPAAGTTSPEDSGPIVWTPALSVGISAIDDQHRLLFGLINDLAELRASGRGREGLVQLIRKLIPFSDAHFVAEEEVMIESDFPLFAAHRHEHQQFLKQLAGFVNDYAQDRRELTDEMMVFLKTWWFRHTSESDLKYARWIRNRQA